MTGTQKRRFILKAPRVWVPDSRQRGFRDDTCCCVLATSYARAVTSQQAARIATMPSVS